MKQLQMGQKQRNPLTRPQQLATQQRPQRRAVLMAHLAGNRVDVQPTGAQQMRRALHAKALKVRLRRLPWHHFDNGVASCLSSNPDSASTKARICVAAILTPPKSWRSARPMFSKCRNCPPNQARPILRKHAQGGPLHRHSMARPLDRDGWRTDGFVRPCRKLRCLSRRVMARQGAGPLADETH